MATVPWAGIAAVMTALAAVLGAVAGLLAARAKGRRDSRSSAARDAEADRRLAKVESAVRSHEERLAMLEAMDRVLSHDIREARKSRPGS